jgi:hypothetical protein
VTKGWLSRSGGQAAGSNEGSRRRGGLGRHMATGGPAHSGCGDGMTPVAMAPGRPTGEGGMSGGSGHGEAGSVDGARRREGRGRQREA